MYLKDQATLERRGVTITGDGAGNQGILSVMGFKKIDRVKKLAEVYCYWWIDEDHKNEFGNEPFDSLVFTIKGDDFDSYIYPAVDVENEAGLYLLPFKRAYDYIEQKASLYLANPDNEDYAEFEISKDLVSSV